MSEMKTFKLRVGKRGEIYTTAELRRIVKLSPGGTILAKVIAEGKILIEVVPTIEELLEKPKKSSLALMMSRS